MPRSVWVRIGIVVAVVAISAWALYPPRKTINLGLDLQGGIHLVLGVDADKAIASQTDRAAEDVKQALEKKGVGVRRVTREGTGTITVELASPQGWNDALTVVNEFSTYERKNLD